METATNATPFIALPAGAAGWKASNGAGATCLHAHRTASAAVRCAARLNQPTRPSGTPRGAYEAAAGYFN